VRSRVTPSPKALRANLLLLITAGIWGLAFVAQRAGMEHVGPFTFNALRFGLGSVSLVPLWWLRRGRGAAFGSGEPVGNRQLLTAGVTAGGVLFVAASLQQIGLVYTTAGKAGFITGLYVVLVPILGMGWGYRVGPGGWLGVGLAAAGLFLLSAVEGMSIGIGDALVLLSALFWALHLLVIARWARRVDPIRLALLQFAVCALLSFVVALPAESLSTRGIQAAAVPILYAGLLSVGVAYTLQVLAQRDAHPTTAAILLSLEAVFAVLGGWLLLGETISLREAMGCLLMLAGVVVSVLGRAARPAVDPEPTRAT
jgi:drug/metabolite transporter (DMT)-like permease